MCKIVFSVSLLSLFLWVRDLCGFACLIADIGDLCLFKIFICTFYFLDEVFRVHQTVNIFMCSMLVPGMTPLLRVLTLFLCSLNQVLLQDPVKAAPSYEIDLL